MSRPMNSFTLIFAGDLRTFGHNPLIKETPYGVPYAVGAGDAFEEIERLQAVLTEIRDRTAGGN